MIEAENRHCTIPKTTESAGFGNQTHKCALVTEHPNSRQRTTLGSTVLPTPG